MRPGGWTPVTAGAMLHEVFEQLVRQLADQNQRPTYPDHLAQLETVLQGRVESCRDHYPPISTHVYRSQLADFARIIRTFLIEEDRYYRQAGHRPEYFEPSLGIPSEEAGKQDKTCRPPEQASRTDEGTA
jgi:hypothetical protein